MIPTDIMAQMRTAFRTEALDLLIELDSALLALEVEPGDSRLVDRVFRAIHTIKGSGGTAGFAHLARFAHTMEEAFQRAREGTLAVTPDLIDCGLKACDVLQVLLADTSGDNLVAGERDVVEAFARLLPSSTATPAGAVDPLVANAPATPIRAAFEIVFKPNREIFYSGANPVTLLDDLRELGELHLTAQVDQIPSLATLEAEHCYLWWNALLVTDRDEAAIRDVFVFVEDDCEVRIHLREDQSGTVALLGSVAADTLELFTAECGDLLEGIERDALALERAPASKPILDALFRGVHSLKGNAGVLLGYVKGDALPSSHALPLLQRVAHGLESLLDPCRAVTADAVSSETVQTALDTCDAIRTLLGGLTDSAAGDRIAPELLARLGLSNLEAPRQRPSVDGREAAFLNTTSQCVASIAGRLRQLDTASEDVGPVLDGYLRGLTTMSAAARYRVCPELEEPLAQQLRIVRAAIETGRAPDTDARAALARAFEATRSVVDRLTATGDAGRGGEPATVEAAATRPDRRDPAAGDRRESAPAPSTIRIDQDKLDRLMRVVGQLLVARGALPSLARNLQDGHDTTQVLKDLKDAGANISRIADDLQSSVMAIRMLPVKTVFQKFPRLVRDLARSLGKEVQLAIEGEGIDLDKTIIEQIADPLVHVIRNAVDHGLERPEDRRAQGKDATGLLTLRARQEAGGVTIEVTDDGRGLDAGKLKRKAVDKGLITADAADSMSDDAAYQLVFLPGLSTAAQVTDVSGRGVGMDVVRSNVQNLHGTIEIRSKPGSGTTFLMKLPASLMVSKGILLEAGGQQYILPLASIRDMVKVPRHHVHEYRGSTIANARGSTYALLDLAELLGLESRPPHSELSVAIVEAGDATYGLVVDKFLSEVDVLINPLNGGLEHCQHFQGAAILGDGRVVLVLNPLECARLDRPVAVP